MVHTVRMTAEFVALGLLLACSPTPSHVATAQPTAVVSHPVHKHGRPLVKGVLPRCPSEDSGRSCIWTGGRNHKGRWFVIDRRGHLTYLPSHRTQAWGTVDGHPHCVGFIGSTTVLVCRDGWVTES